MESDLFTVIRNLDLTAEPKPNGYPFELFLMQKYGSRVMPRPATKARIKRAKDVRIATVVGTVYGKYEGEEYEIGVIKLDEKNGLFRAIYDPKNIDKFIGYFKNITLAMNAIYDHWMETE